MMDGARVGDSEGDTVGVESLAELGDIKMMNVKV